MCTNLDRVAIEGLIEKVKFESALKIKVESHLSLWGKSGPGDGISKCRGPQASTCSAMEEVSEVKGSE